MFLVSRREKEEGCLVNAGKLPRGRIIGRSCGGRRDDGRWHRGPEENNCVRDERGRRQYEGDLYRLGRCDRPPSAVVAHKREIDLCPDRLHCVPSSSRASGPKPESAYGESLSILSPNSHQQCVLSIWFGVKLLLFCATSTVPVPEFVAPISAYCPPLTLAYECICRYLYARWKTR